MKVKNEYVQVKIGDKTYTKKNTLLDRFLERIFKSQIDLQHNSAEITTCYIKLDTPLEYVDINNVVKSDFDIELYGGTSSGTSSRNNFEFMAEKNKNSVKITYNYNPYSSTMFEYNNEYYESSQFEMFIGRKITAIGFGSGVLFAIVDTSNMGIYIDSNEIFQITRVDLYQSDGVVKGLDFPLHLVNDNAHYNITYNDNIMEETRAQLYSVGFGNIIGSMEEEHLINDVLDETGDTYINLNVNREKKLGHYPSEDLQLGFYPTLDNSKYLIFKYRLYKEITIFDTYGETTTTYEYLDEYYTMSMPNETFGDINVKLKIERL